MIFTHSRTNANTTLPSGVRKGRRRCTGQRTGEIQHWSPPCCPAQAQQQRQWRRRQQTRTARPRWTRRLKPVKHPRATAKFAAPPRNPEAYGVIGSGITAPPRGGHRLVPVYADVCSTMTSLSFVTFRREKTSVLQSFEHTTVLLQLHAVAAAGAVVLAVVIPLAIPAAILVVTAPMKLRLHLRLHLRLPRRLRLRLRLPRRLRLRLRLPRRLRLRRRWSRRQRLRVQSGLAMSPPPRKMPKQTAAAMRTNRPCPQ